MSTSVPGPKAAIDDSKCRAACEEMDAILGRLPKPLPERLPPDLLKRIAPLLDCLTEQPHEFFVFKGKGLLADRAPEDRIFLEPTARFEELLAALRAVERDLQGVGIL